MSTPGVSDLCGDGEFHHLAVQQTVRTYVDGEYVEPTTGGRKGAKLARFDLIPVGPLTEVAECYGMGAAKYDSNNWRRGYPWSLSYAALQRHLTAFWGGESHAPDDGQHHLASVIFHAFALMEFEGTHPELDDRYRP